jgi:sulfite dehydrogenase
MKARLSFIVALAGISLGAGPAAALKITLPDDRSRLVESPLPGYALAQSLCYTCHSVDYVRTQPFTTVRATWKTMVVKMQKTFGAPIPDDAIDPIAEYLARTYGAERTGAGNAPASAPAASAVPKP